MIRGFDISHWNQNADLVAAKAAGFQFVYLKATEGTNYTDPTFAERKAAAKAAGVAAGAYLFLQPDQPVAAQVARFIDVVGNDMPMRVALDHETASSRGVQATAAAARAAMSLLERHYGYAPLLYTYPSFAADGSCEGLGSYPLWIADYAKIPTPRIGHVWTDWAAWQVGQGVVAGISGGDGPATDVNIARSLEPLLAPSNVPTPSPTPQPVPTTQGEPVQIIRATGRSAATLDSAGLAHPISSSKWSALVHAGQKGLTVEIATQTADDYDACIPAAPAGLVEYTGQHAHAETKDDDPFLYDHSQCDGIAVPDGKIGA